MQELSATLEKLIKSLEMLNDKNIIDEYTPFIDN